MSYRISWYELPKNLLKKYDSKYKLYCFLSESQSQIYFDCCTDVIWDLNKENLKSTFLKRYYPSENDDIDIWFLSKEGLKEKIIPNVQNRVIKHLEFLQDNKEKYNNELAFKIYCLKNNLLPELDDEKKFRISPQITYEDVLFDLVFLYKTFDFENNYLVLIGA